MIQGVDKVRAQLQVETFLEAESLRQGQVNNRQPWSPEVIPAFVAELEQRSWICWARCRGACKRRSIKPLGASFGSINFAHNVGEPIAPIVDVAPGSGAADAAAGNGLIQVSIHHHCERISALRNEGSRDAPSAYEYIYHLAAVEKPLALTKWKLVRGISLEGDGNVKIGIAVIG